MNTAEFVIGYLCAMVIVSILIFIGIALHMAYTKIDLMLECLKNSTAIMNRAPLRHGGPWGKLLLIGGISGIVTFPAFHLRRGGLANEDLNNFPVPLKRKLALIQWSVIGLFSTMTFLVLLEKSGLLK